MQICADSGGNVVEATKTESGTGVDVTFSASDLSFATDGQTYYIVAYRTGTSLGQSAKSTAVSVTATTAYIATPSISGPSTGSEIVNTSQRGVALSSFSVVGGSDTAAGKQVKICSDSAGQNIVAQQYSEGDGWVWFDENDWGGLTGTYYAFGRWQGTMLGWSEWSEPVAWTIRDPRVDAPWISSPDYHSYILRSGFEVEVVRFGSEVEDDTQTAMEIQLLDDDQGTTVHTWTQSGSGLTFSSGDLSSYSLTDGGAYKIRVRQQSAALGWSEWSDVEVEYLDVSETFGDNSFADIADLGARGIASQIWDIGDVVIVDFDAGVGHSDSSPYPQAPGAGQVGMHIAHFDLYNQDGVYLMGFEGKDISHGGTLTIPAALVRRVGDRIDGGETDGSMGWNWFLGPNRQISGNAGGWKGSPARNWLLGSTDTDGSDSSGTETASPSSGSLMAALPQDLRAVMATFDIYTDNYGDVGDPGPGGSFSYNSSTEAGQLAELAEHVTVSTDFIVFPAEYEVFGNTQYANPGEEAYQTQLDVFANGVTGPGSKARYAFTGKANYPFVEESSGASTDATYSSTPALKVGWWLRSPSLMPTYMQFQTLSMYFTVTGDGWCFVGTTGVKGVSAERPGGSHPSDVKSLPPDSFPGASSSTVFVGMCPIIRLSKEKVLP